ncbi:hypothetical protein [Reinekea sp.]|jgi:hypothetical protein|uniref:hypothetical protein n=1 Tax=Reinekea sp. TaxID=1970455 RepID=UPI00398A05DA
MYWRVIDRLALKSFKSDFESPHPVISIWDRLVLTFSTFGITDIALRPGRYELGHNNRITTFVFGILAGPALDMWVYIVMPIFAFTGMFGHTHLPDLRITRNPTPRDAFKEKPLPDANFLVASPCFSSATIDGDCDGHYLWMLANLWERFFYSVFNIIALVTIVILAFDNPSQNIHLLWLIIPILGLAWFPHRKGALFDRDAQTVTFFRGMWRKPIVVPFNQTGFTSHLTGTGNLTQGLTLVSKLRPKGKWLPLSIGLSTGGGRGNDIASEAGAIEAFMDLDNQGAFCKKMLKDIKLFRTHQLTMWRLNWRKPPAEEWARYQEPDSLYQRPLPDNTTCWEWQLAYSPEARKEVENREKVEKFVQLIIAKKDHENEALIQDVLANQPDEATELLKSALTWITFPFSNVLNQLKELGNDEPKYLMDIFLKAMEFKRRFYSTDYSELRTAFAEFEQYKKDELQSGRLPQVLYDYLEPEKCIQYFKESNYPNIAQQLM